MEYITLSWIDYSLFVFIFGMSVTIGIYFGCFGKQQNTRDDYLLGGKKLKVFPVSMSLVASTLSGVSLLGIPAEVYMHGMQFSMLFVGLILMAICVMYIYLPVFYKLQLSSPYQYLKLRFDKRVKILASVLYITVNLSFLPIVIYAPSLSLNQMTGFNIYLIALLMSIICITYTTIGGLKAIVWTDTLQFSITLCTLGCVFIMGTISVGGLSNIWNKAFSSGRLEFFNMNPNPTIRNTFWTVVIGEYFYWLFSIGVGAISIQRFLSVPTIGDAKKILVIFVVLASFTKTICCFSGLIMYAKYFDCDPFAAGLMKRPDQIVPFYVSEVAKDIPGLSGLFAAGLFSTSLSTLSTVLNTVSGIIYSDFLASFLTYTDYSISEGREGNIIKLTTVVVGLISVALIFIIEKFGSILELIIGFCGISIGPILGLVTLGMLFPCANNTGALYGGIGSFVLMSFLLIKTKVHAWNGDFHVVYKPLDTYGCNLTTSNLPVMEFQNMTSITSSDEEVFWLFRISFHYYCMLGALATILIGLLVSYATKSNSDPIKNIDLLCPCVHRFVNKANLSRYDEVEKELNSYKIDNLHRDYKLPESSKLLQKNLS